MQGAPSLGPPVAVFKEASCTGGGSFVAIANDGEYRLEVGIGAFDGFGRQYPLTSGGTEPTFVIDGPLGTFGNAHRSPLAGGTVGNCSGGINFSSDGRRFGFAFGKIPVTLTT